MTAIDDQPWTWVQEYAAAYRAAVAQGPRPEKDGER